MNTTYNTFQEHIHSLAAVIPFAHANCSEQK